ncbi:MAG: LPXTG cell wall anchor domain-containing protein [Erysipelotrichaceae bacterium]|nr:LPXTG cell wall anchor domain-containing protein [Erysipelotrichaceae bacterium]
MKMLRKSLSLIFTICLVMGLSLTVTKATDGSTINGQLDLSSVTSDSSGDGWCWIESEKTLTLSNLSIINDGNYQSAIVLPHYNEGVTYTIVLEGDNYITGFNEEYGRAFVVGSDTYSGSKDDLTLSGSGFLTISDCGYVLNGGFQNVIIDGTTITATVNTTGFIVGNTFTIKNYANVSITANGLSGYGIYAIQGINIIDSTVTVSIPNSKNAAFCIFNINSTNSDGSITIENSTITVQESPGYSIYCYSANGIATTSIKNSTINENSAKGVRSIDKLILDGSVKILTDSNRQVLRSTSIIDNLDDNADIQGYAYEGNNLYYLTDYTLKNNFEVPTGQTLTIPEGVTLTLTDGVTLFSEDSGAIINEGTIIYPCNRGGVADGSLSTASTGKIENSHSYEDPTFTWSDDYSSATATFTCADCNLKKNMNATITSKETKATCTTQGVTTYSATVTLNGNTYTDTKGVTNISAIGHSYGEPVFTWSDDYSSATATFTCTNDSSHVVTMNTKVISNTTAAKCTSDGSITYTASVTFNGSTYTDIKTVTIEAAHNLVYIAYKAPTATTTGNNEYWYCQVCGHYFLDEQGLNVADYEEDILISALDDIETTKVTDTINVDTGDDTSSMLYAGIMTLTIGVYYLLKKKKYHEM